MNLINYDYSVVDDDLMKCINTFNNSNDLDIKMDALNFLTTLKNYIYTLRQSKNINKKEMYNKFLMILENSDFMDISNIINCYYDQFMQNFIKNEKYLLRILNQQKDLISKFNLHNNCINDVHIDASNIYNLVTSYYDSENDQKSLLLFNMMIFNGRILGYNNLNYLGQTVSYKVPDKEYIILNDNFDFDMLLTIIHEMAHVKYTKQVKSIALHNDYNKYIYESCYMEVPPYKEERDFLKFLAQSGNKILEKLAINETVNILSSYQCFADKINNPGMFYDRNTAITRLKTIYGHLLSNMMLQDKSIKLNDYKDLDIDFYSLIDNYGEDAIINSVTAPLDAIKKLRK